MAERIGEYEIIDAGVPYTPAERPSRPVTMIWGRRWTLRRDGVDHEVLFEADLGLQDALDARTVVDDVREAFETDGGSAIEAYALREPDELPARVELAASGLVESAP